MRRWRVILNSSFRAGMRHGFGTSSCFRGARRASVANMCADKTAMPATTRDILGVHLSAEREREDRKIDDELTLLVDDLRQFLAKRLRIPKVLTVRVHMQMHFCRVRLNQYSSQRYSSQCKSHDLGDVGPEVLAELLFEP